MLFLLFEDDLINGRREALNRMYSFLNVGESEIDLDVWSLATKPVSLPVHPVLSQFGRWSAVRWLSQTRPMAGVKKLLKREVPKKLDAAIRRQLLNDHYAKEIKDLEQLIGRDLGRWSAVGQSRKADTFRPVQARGEAL